MLTEFKFLGPVKALAVVTDSILIRIRLLVVTETAFQNETGGGLWTCNSARA